MPAGEEVVCSEQLVTGDDENTQIRLKYKYKHTQRTTKNGQSCALEVILQVSRVLEKKLESKGF